MALALKAPYSAVIVGRMKPVPASLAAAVILSVALLPFYKLDLFGDVFFDYWRASTAMMLICALALSAFRSRGLRFGYIGFGFAVGVFAFLTEWWFIKGYLPISVEDRVSRSYLWTLSIIGSVEMALTGAIFTLLVWLLNGRAVQRNRASDDAAG